VLIDIIQSAMDIAHIDAGLQQLQEILREEILNNQRLSAPADSAASNDASRTSELISALSKVGELEHAAAQSDLMKKAALNALSASQAELCRLQEGSEAQKQQVADTNALNAELRNKVESLTAALAESQNAADALQASLADKDAELREALSRCQTLENAAAHISSAEVSRLHLQLRMRDEAAAEESKHVKELLLTSEQSLAEAKSQLDDALRSNILSNAEWKSRHDRKCDEYCPYP
jgi:hypothetical protein